MNSNITPDVNENVSDTDILKKRRKSNIIALIVCTLLAFVLWLAIRNATPDENEGPSIPPSYDQIVE